MFISRLPIKAEAHILVARFQRLPAGHHLRRDGNRAGFTIGENWELIYVTDGDTPINLFHSTVNQCCYFIGNWHCFSLFVFNCNIKLSSLFSLNNFNFLSSSLYVLVLYFFFIFVFKLFFNKLFKIEALLYYASTRERRKNELAKRWSVGSRYISPVRGPQTTRVARFISWRVIHLAAPSEARCSLSLFFVALFPFSCLRISFATKKL